MDLSWSGWFDSVKRYLVALNRRPKMGPDAYESGLMELYWMGFADLNFRPRNTPGAFVFTACFARFGALRVTSRPGSPRRYCYRRCRTGWCGSFSPPGPSSTAWKVSASNW